MVLTGTCLYLLTMPGFVHECFMSAFYAFQHCALQASDCVCMANVIVKSYLPYHISRAAKLWCLPLLSPGFFLEIKVVIFNRRGTHTHTQTPFITEIHIIYYFSTVHLHCWWLTQSLARRISVFLDGCSVTLFFSCFFAGGVVLEEECISL